LGTLIALLHDGEMPREMDMKTGLDVMESGLYVSECCGEEVELVEDATFPRCVRCMGLTEWELVELPEQQAA
jgi:hypothetical protein